MHETAATSSLPVLVGPGGGGGPVTAVSSSVWQ